MLARRRDDRPPAPRRAGLRERHLGEACAVELAGLVVGPDDVEREVLEHPVAHAVARRAASSSRSRTSVVDRLCRPREPVAMERAIDDRRDPPAGDRVLAQLEQAGALARPRRVSAVASRRAGAPIGVARTRARSPSRGLRDRRRVVGGALPARRRLRGDRGRDDAGHAAGIDQLEVREVDRHVQGDAVVAHAALDAQPEGADLARGGPVRVAPAARVSVAPAGPTPSAAQVATRAASSARTNGRTSRPRSASRMIG